MKSDNVNSISGQDAFLKMSLLDVIFHEFMCAEKQHKCTAASVFAVDDGEDSCTIIE